MNISDLIYTSISMNDVLEMYHHLGKNNRVECPIHKGTNNNFCYTEKVYHCWTCGAKGNVITFVMEIFGLPYMEAARKINSDFNLNIDFNNKMSYRQREKIRRRLIEVREEYQSRKMQEEAEKIRYNNLMDEYSRLDKIRIRQAPKTPNDTLSDEYVNAMHRLPVIEYRLDMEDWRCGSE